jgi:Ca2+-transporting ATPase
MSCWFNRETHETVQAFSSHAERGLTTGEAGKRLAEAGPNQLEEHRKIAPFRIFLEQFSDFMVLVLIGAAIVSGLLGEKADAITIVAIVVLNAVLGFVQEFRAEKSLAALRELTAPLAHVLRDSKVQRIPAKNLVPGDILILESGDKVAADGRIIAAVDLELNEATLTGESLPVVKTMAVLRQDRLSLGDQRNMVFAGTVVCGGRGRAVVTATGMKTEIGKIAGMIGSAQDDETPLQKRLEQLGRWLVVLCLGICAAVGTMGIVRGEPPRQMFLSAVSLAVAAIPEGLPAIVTIALAIGVQKMIKRNAIIRKLPAVETLGCATVICSDKTGTLTQNELTVTKVWTGVKEYSLETEAAVAPAPDLRQVLEIGALCNNAQLEQAPGSKRPVSLGDPTEGALLVAAQRCGMEPLRLARQTARLGELAFSSDRKRMSVLIQDPQGQRRLLTKGAADVLLGRCGQVVTSAGIVPLTPSLQAAVRARVDQWSAEALRVLAFAYRPADPRERLAKDGPDPEVGLVFAGLVGMNDPPRPESRLAVERSKRAGIKVKMITGDYPRTAAAIGKQIGLLRPAGKIITGAELDELSDAALAKVIGEIDIFARVSPHHKLRVVRALKQNGEIVAMTGDGVNDAPAVKEADIGVAMGESGTDVTKEAAAMVIADDNFATIVAAVEEGRTIYENIRKFIRYLLSCNMGEILTMFGGIAMGLPVPLLPIQILWVNLVTDGLPAIALGLEQGERDTMCRPPRSPREGIFSRGLSRKIVFQGLMIGAATLLVYIMKLRDGGDLATARTMAFAALVFAQLFFVFQCRSEEHSMLEIGLWENPYLVGAALLSFLMQVGAMTLPWLQRVFYTTSLTWNDWLFVLAVTALSAYLSDLLFQFRNVIKKHLGIFRWKTHRVQS